MSVVFMLLLIGAVVCFGVAAFFTPTRARVNLVALGLFLWVLVDLIKVLT